MKNQLKHSVLCVTISMLFVLGAFANQRLLGSKTTGIALFTAAIAPPSSVEVTWNNGPNFPPDPVDIPSASR